MRKMNEYERKIRMICTRNKLSFRRSSKISVDKRTPDFINREKKLIIEVWNPGRDFNLTQERVNGFHKHGYRVLLISEGDFNYPDATPYLTRAIKGFYG